MLHRERLLTNFMYLLCFFYPSIRLTHLYKNKQKKVTDYLWLVCESDTHMKTRVMIGHISMLLFLQVLQNSLTLSRFVAIMPTADFPVRGTEHRGWLEKYKESQNQVAFP